MRRPRVVNIFGTRPEAIKMAPVVRAFKEDGRIDSHVVVTAQHREMLDQVLHLFEIHPDKDLDIMEQDQTLYDLTRRVLKHLEEVLKAEKPDLVLVQGDTTTAFVAALGAFYQKIPVGHVEAGLRTDNKYEPFPEEINRRLISTLADLHFAPTPRARDNLAKNGVDKKNVFLTGNTVIDALHYILREKLPPLPAEVEANLHPGSRIILVEVHRRENLGRPLKDICSALKKIVENFADVEIVFSVHKNPSVRREVFPRLSGLERVHLLEPVDYPVLLRLMKDCFFILTDSGGIQEEAPAIGKPVLVCRRTTERPEGIEAGTAVLVGTRMDSVYEGASHLLINACAYERMSRAINPYGDGCAAKRTVGAILYFLGLEKDRPEEFSPRPCVSISRDDAGVSDRVGWRG